MLRPLAGAFAKRVCILVAELGFYLCAIILDCPWAQTKLTRDVSGAAAPADQAEDMKLAISQC